MLAYANLIIGGVILIAALVIFHVLRKAFKAEPRELAKERRKVKV